MTGAPADSDPRRARILEAALAVAARRGAGRLTVAAVARGAGVSPKTVYRRLGGREEILAAAVRRAGEMLLGDVAQASAGSPGAVELLRRLLRLHVRGIRGGAGWSRLLLAEGVEGRGVSHRMAAYHLASRYLDRIAAVVRRGQRSGEIREGLHPGSVAVLFLGLLQPPAALWHLSGGRFDLAGYAERSFDLFAEAIRPRPGRPGAPAHRSHPRPPY